LQHGATNIIFVTLAAWSHKYYQHMQHGATSITLINSHAPYGATIVALINSVAAWNH